MAQRSVQIVFADQTSQGLVLLDFTVQHGILSGNPPPQAVQANSNGTWGTESSGAFTGTQGTANYAVQANPGEIITLTWDNPFEGTSVYTATFPSGFSMTINNGDGTVATPVGNQTTVTGGGNNANITYTLTAS